MQLRTVRLTQLQVAGCCRSQGISMHSVLSSMGRACDARGIMQPVQSYNFQPWLVNVNANGELREMSTTTMMQSHNSNGIMASVGHFEF